MNKARLVAALGVLFLPAVFVVFLSSADYSFFEKGESQLKFSFKHSGEIKRKCTEEEIKAFMEKMKLRPEHMRHVEPVCGRERFPVFVELYVDGVEFLSRAYEPRGFGRDLPSYGYEVFRVEPGSHEISINMRDSGRTEGYDIVFNQRVEFRPGYLVIVDFDEVKKGFFIRP
jgi:hypothetical protein